MTLTQTLRAALVTALLFSAPYSYSASLLGDYAPGGSTIPCGTCGDVSGTTFGWAFGVTETITVNGIGLWDAGADGIGRDVLAGLWVDGGSLLASATITNSSALEISAGDGGWRMETIGNVVLDPGLYVIGAIGYNHSTIQSTPFTTLPGITLPANPARFGSDTPDSGFIRPDLDFGGPLTAYPNLRVTDNATIPTPASILLVLSGIALLIRQRRKEAAY